MINIGYNIRQANDILRPIEAADLAKRIKHPDPKFVDFIQQLRMVLSIDPKKYRELKTKLPYIVAAGFNPPYRRIENFASCNHLIVDLDHLQAKNIDLELLRKKVNADDRVFLSFSSPSGDGLKVIFRFTPPLTDAAKYSIFYKIFTHQLASELDVHQVIDRSTSDVSRACFVSYDPEVYFNAEAKEIVLANIIDFENHLTLNQLLEATSTTDNLRHDPKDPDHNERTLTGQDLPQDIFQKIKEQLNPALAQKREKKIFVPSQLDELIPHLQSAFEEHKLKMDEVKNIHYGKQIRVSHGYLWGEINVHYGKKGFSIVKSTKSGSNERLTEVAAMIVLNLLESEPQA